MGLDMYLSAKVSLFHAPNLATLGEKDSEGFTHQARENKMASDIVGVFGFDVPDDGSSLGQVQVTLPVGQWRKANHIHNFFLNGREDNCEPIYINDDVINDLERRCQKVLKNNLLAEDRLPTMSGFFFGSTEYDEGYFADLEDTLEVISRWRKIKASLEEKKLFVELVYQASW